jgi:hypothetical protein
MAGFKIWRRASWRDAWESIGVAATRRDVGALVAKHIAETDGAHIEIQLTEARGAFVVMHRPDRAAEWSEKGRYDTRAEAVAALGAGNEGGDLLIRFEDTTPGTGF